jgi:hypothetical protein
MYPVAITVINAVRAFFDLTAVRVMMILLLGIPGLGFLVWTLLIEGTGFRAYFTTASASEQAALRMAATLYWVLVAGWLGMLLRLLCSSSYLDTVPMLRLFMLLCLAVFTVLWTFLLFRSTGVSWLTFVPSLLTLFLIIGTLPRKNLA